MKTIFEDKYIVIINKKPGELAQPDDSPALSCLQHLEKQHNHSLYIINRVDRPVSGIMLFAKTKKSAAAFSKMIREGQINKFYYAAVADKPAEDQAVLNNYIYKKGNKSFISNDGKKGKKSSLVYNIIGSSERYHFLKIQLNTGRFHQIRNQLSFIGCPIKGDVKYGARRSNKDRSIHLHAFEISFLHPFTNQEVNIKADFPADPVWDALDLTNN